jgi:hypothetical protein
MDTKVINLSKERRKRKPKSIDEIVESAIRQYCNPEFLAAIGEEPIGLASGKTNAQGGFIRGDEDDLLADQERKEDDSQDKK